MKYQKVVFEICKCLLVCAVIFLSFPASADPETNKPNVDDLVIFMLYNFANKLELSTKETSFVTNFELPPQPEKSSNKTVLLDFISCLSEVEDKYGHLPEYWELRAHLEIDIDFTQVNDKLKEQLSYIFTNKLSSIELNYELLKKSLDLNPSNASVMWFLDMIELEEQYPDGIDRKNPPAVEIVREYYLKRAKIHADAGLVETENAFYPMYEAVYWHNAGNDDAALKAFKRAGECDNFNYPRIFPSAFAMKHIPEFEDSKYPFHYTTPSARYYLYLNFFCRADELPNFTLLRGPYRDFIADYSSTPNWRETYNVLHRAACVMGKGESFEDLNGLVAMTLIKICLADAMKQAIDIGDTELEKALIVLTGITNHPKIMNKAAYIDDEKNMFAFIFGTLFDHANLKNDQKPLFYLSLSKIIPPSIRHRVQMNLHEECIKPVFENLETFDYTNPDVWYETWFEKTFPYLYKTEEEKTK